ncbi:SDR family NAD(P)-dependent oxidoreductase [Rugosimonospora acidiphila]|uniref:SDR family NAD(P)-dependent oxidoreductase n=1 Tax=Rugosimonospora acidiphila TaxID=556531 RepID=A0ABP9SE27_9ACTN
MRINDRVALVTGASSGIGRATAIRLAQLGARVILHGRDEQALASLAESVDGVVLRGELAAAPEQVERIAREAVQAYGRVDILINNAGAGWAGPFGEMTGEDLERLVSVNLSAPLRLTRALLPGMLERGAGYLMFVTSIAGRTGVAGEAVYSATKSGLDAFAESLRFELRGSGVGVGVLVPGVVDTRFFDRRGQPYQRQRPRPLPPGPVAEAMVRAIVAGRAEAYAPRWLRLPVAVRGALPGVYRGLAGRFGGS